MEEWGTQCLRSMHSEWNLVRSFLSSLCLAYLPSMNAQLPGKIINDNPQGFNKLFGVQGLSFSSVLIQLLRQWRTCCVTFCTDRWIFSSYFCHYLFWYFFHFSSNIKSRAERKLLILLDAVQGIVIWPTSPIALSSRPTSQHCTHMQRWSCWWMLDWMYASSGTTDSPL